MMKKGIRLIALVAVLAICLSLCGCKYLDDLRAVQGKVVSTGVIRLQDGTEYKRIYQTCDELVPVFSRSVTFHITEGEDIPLLLTPTFCATAYRSNDELFLRVYLDTELGLYCRTDVYDSVVERIKNGFQPEVFCYEYYDYKTGEYLVYELTQEQADALEQVYATGEAIELPAAATLSYDYYVDLYRASADHLFQQDCMDLCLSDGKYYLVFGERILYPVPEEHRLVISQIMTAESGINYK